MNKILEKIKKYPNHIVLGGNDPSGGMQQNANELEKLCLFIKENNIKTYTEIGIAKGLLLKFMKEEMGLIVQGITLEQLPEHENLPVIYGDSTKKETIQKANFSDLYFIDGDHSYETVKMDYENYKTKCHFMAFHDMLGYRNCEGVLKLWNDLKKTHQHWEFADSNPGIASGIGVIKI